MLGLGADSIRLSPLGQPGLAQPFDDTRVFALKLRTVRPVDVGPVLHCKAWHQLVEAGDRGLGLCVAAEPAVGGGDIDVRDPKPGVGGD